MFPCRSIVPPPSLLRAYRLAPSGTVVRVSWQQRGEDRGITRAREVESGSAASRDVLQVSQRRTVRELSHAALATAENGAKLSFNEQVFLHLLRSGYQQRRLVTPGYQAPSESLPVRYSLK